MFLIVIKIIRVTKTAENSRKYHEFERIKIAGDTILFVQRQGRKIREFIYSWDKDGYISPDLTILADHITESGVIETALQQQPDTILWCLLADGSIAALTYERDQEVCGWQKHVTDGKILSIAILPNKQNDDIYITVERNGKRMLEYFAPRSYETLPQAVFSDSSIIVSGQSILNITNLGHLEGQTIQVFADGAEQTDKIVTDGTITLDTPADRVCVGVAYESLLSPMPYELQMQNGYSLLRQKAIGEVRVRMYDSLGGDVRAGDGVWQTLISRSVDDEVNTFIPEKSEIVVVNPQGGWARSPGIEIRQTRPFPLNVSVIVAICEVSE